MKDAEGINGFKTFYLSTQTDSLVSSIGGANYIDHISTRELAPIQVKRKQDMYLLEQVKNQVYGKKNFIVLHQSSVHSPYEWTYGEDYRAETIFSGQKDPLLDQYDNAMLYNDMIISEIFKFFNKSNSPYYIIFASDHNELLRENGFTGHGILIPEVAQIPVLVQSNDSKFLGRIKDTFLITHYELAKLVAERIGFDIINPNETAEPNIFYINGSNYCGLEGYIRFKKDSLKREVHYEKPIYM